MVTEAQATIIRRVCNIQFKSLEQLITDVNLDEDSEETMKMFQISRHEMDKAFITIYKRFEEVKVSPEKVEELDYEYLLIFLLILGHIKGEFMEIYPNAFKNLLDKIISLITIKEYLN